MTKVNVYLISNERRRERERVRTMELSLTFGLFQVGPNVSDFSLSVCARQRERERGENLH